MSIDLTKPVETRDGHSARIICTNKDYPGFPVVALVTVPGSLEVIHFYNIEGGHHPEHASGYDLRNIPEFRTEYVNLMFNVSTQRYSTFSFITAKRARKAAKKYSSPGLDIIKTALEVKIPY